MLPGMLHAIPFVITPSVMADPFVSAIDMRSVRVSFLIGVVALLNLLLAHRICLVRGTCLGCVVRCRSPCRRRHRRPSVFLGTLSKGRQTYGEQSCDEHACTHDHSLKQMPKSRCKLNGRLLGRPLLYRHALDISIARDTSHVHKSQGAGYMQGTSPHDPGRHRSKYYPRSSPSRRSKLHRTVRHSSSSR